MPFQETAGKQHFSFLPSLSGCNDPAWQQGAVCNCGLFSSSSLFPLLFLQYFGHNTEERLFVFPLTLSLTCFPNCPLLQFLLIWSRIPILPSFWLSRHLISSCFGNNRRKVFAVSPLTLESPCLHVSFCRRSSNTKSLHLPILPLFLIFSVTSSSPAFHHCADRGWLSRFFSPPLVSSCLTSSPLFFLMSCHLLEITVSLLLTPLTESPHFCSIVLLLFSPIVLQISRGSTVVSHFVLSNIISPLHLSFKVRKVFWVCPLPLQKKPLHPLHFYFEITSVLFPTSFCCLSLALLYNLVVFSCLLSSLVLEIIREEGFVLSFTPNLFSLPSQ